MAGKPGMRWKKNGQAMPRAMDRDPLKVKEAIKTAVESIERRRDLAIQKAQEIAARDVAAVIDFLEGMPAWQVAQKYNISESSIRTHTIMRGISLCDLRKSAKGSKPGKQAESMPAVMELITNTDMPYDDISVQVGCSYNYVHHLATINGMHDPNRTRSKQNAELRNQFRSIAEEAVKDNNRVVAEARAAYRTKMKAIRESQEKLREALKARDSRRDKEKIIVRNMDRLRDMATMRHNGATLDDIGNKYQFSRERARQILNAIDEYYYGDIWEGAEPPEWFYEEVKAE